MHGLTGLGGNKQLRSNSFPSMAVNQQNGHIYIAWCEQVASENQDIYFSKSTDNGLSWSTPQKVNQDNSINDQWFPWITCDPNNNAIAVVYFDSRNFLLNDQADTYVSISYDDGNTWQDFKINDISWVPFGPISGYDYIGIDSKFGHIVPVWSQGNNSQVYVYTQPFDIPCPSNLDLKYGNYFITDEVNFSEDASYSASNKIYVAGQTINNSTYKIYPTASVYMTAGNEIELDDGFESEGEFIAEIAPCTHFSSLKSNINLNSSNKNLNKDDILVLSYFMNTPSSNLYYRVFPNPAFHFINIIASESIHSILIKDLIGKILIQQTLPPESNTHTLDISVLSNGLYLCEIHLEHSIFTEKIMVQK